VDDAVEMTCDCVSKEQFKTTPESQRQIEYLALFASIHKALIDIEPDIKVCIDDHISYIETEAAIGAEKRLIEEIREVIGAFEEISDVKIECHPIVPLSE
jgi:hypothetical protein